MSNIIIFLGMTNSNIQVAEFQMIIFLSKDLNTVKKNWLEWWNSYVNILYENLKIWSSVNEISQTLVLLAFQYVA